MDFLAKGGDEFLLNYQMILISDHFTDVKEAEDEEEIIPCDKLH